jgi:hypothetical protein
MSEVKTPREMTEISYGGVGRGTLEDGIVFLDLIWRNCVVEGDGSIDDHIL